MLNKYVYQTIEEQQNSLIEIIYKNPNLKAILEKLDMPNSFSWYIGGGCVNQTVWNFLTNRDIEYGIGDYDLTYWSEDISEAAEADVKKNIIAQFENLNIKLDVVNQARVHIWFEEDFGEKMEPYTSIEHAISTWPTTATCVAVTKKEGKHKVLAPYGLSDLFSMTLRPNIPSVLDEVFKTKITKWTKKWPELTVIDPRLFS